MSGRQVKVVIEADVSAYLAVLRRVSEQLEAAAPRFRASLARAARRAEHQARHHRTEEPTRSAMHAAYDRRRRARRARGRR